VPHPCQLNEGARPLLHAVKPMERPWSIQRCVVGHTLQPGTPLARPAAAKVHGAAEAGVPKHVSTIAESGTAALFTAK
jgi:hypothetical protein